MIQHFIGSQVQENEQEAEAADVAATATSTAEVHQPPVNDEASDSKFNYINYINDC